MASEGSKCHPAGHDARERASAAILAELGGREGGEDAARKIERSAFNAAVKKSREAGSPRTWASRLFSSQYEQRAVYCVRNARQMASLLDRGARPDDIASATSQTLHPEVWTPLVEDKKKRDHETNKGSQLKPNTTSFRCGRCRSRECYFYELQTRSADEPMSVFITCLDCGHRWRIG